MLRLLTLSAAFLLGTASMAAAQSGACNSVDLPEVEEQYTRRVEGGVSLIDVQGPFLVRCEGGAELRAQQGTLNELTREFVLIGNVDYRDPTRTLTAQQATYSSVIGRLYATGNVVFVDREEGMTIRGPDLEYYRAMAGRPDAQVNAGQRPHLTLQPRGKKAGTDAQPLEIDADRMTILGRNDLSAYGNVIIQRPDLRATAGEARYDGNREALDLRQNARIHSKENALAGDAIHARMPGGELEHVLARGGAKLEGEDLEVRAPELQLFFRDGLIQRSVARSPGAKEGSERALALSRTFRLEADSIDARLPGQRLEEVVAVGGARGEAIDTTRADSLAPPSAPLAAGAGPRSLIDHDWLVGDTITGFFARADSAERAAEAGAAEADSTVVLKRLVARGNAQSVYRMETRKDGAKAQAPPGGKSVNFVSAAVIELHMEAGEVQVAELTDVKRGLYLEPVAPGQPRSGSGPGNAPEAPARSARAGGNE